MHLLGVLAACRPHIQQLCSWVRLMWRLAALLVGLDERSSSSLVYERTEWQQAFLCGLYRVRRSAMRRYRNERKSRGRAVAAATASPRLPWGSSRRSCDSLHTLRPATAS